MYFPLFEGVLCLSLFLVCTILCCVLFSFAIILKRKRELVALLLLSHGCLVTVNVLWFFLTVPYVGLQCYFLIKLAYFFCVTMRTKLLCRKVHALLLSSLNRTDSGLILL